MSKHYNILAPSDDGTFFKMRFTFYPP